ncbi:hypothetical protein PVAND_014168 [Polypedilum vanderplanki]|uniref:Fatty acid hydroxylase domain-containing protein n=1 Tax=Polypedilum vanderplanki TaxID=319348 RepID=A0A9J6CTH6_POLVA|nr:hypothetical protein PVAND_014168 [Polypedilum vanderplanki]
MILKAIFKFFNPLVVYIPFVFGITKIFEMILGYQNIWNSLWNQIVLYLGQDELTYVVCLPNLIFLALSLGLGWVYNILDVLDAPKCLTKYRLNELTNNNKKIDLFKVSMNVLQNNLLNPIMTISTFYLCKKFISYEFKLEAPSFFILIRDLSFYIIVQDIFTFYIHRLLHNPIFYKYHKKHHQMKPTRALNAIRFDFFDYFFANYIPFIIGMIIHHPHVATGILWSIITSFTSTTIHCGYGFPSFYCIQFHNDHHLK